MSKISKKLQLEVNIMQYKVHANSPYNDGWTRELYKEMYDKEKEKLKKYEQNRSKKTSNK